MTNAESIRNFAYFTLNFTDEFIEECWKDEPSLASHLREKFHSYSGEKAFISGGDFIHFYAELSPDRQIELAEWIDINYKAF